MFVEYPDQKKMAAFNRTFQNSSVMTRRVNSLVCLTVPVVLLVFALTSNSFAQDPFHAYAYPVEYAHIEYSSSPQTAYPVPRLFQGTRTAIAHVGVTRTVVASRTERMLIQGMHILDRPYRPFHFYGNTIRRRYYRQLYR